MKTKICPKCNKEKPVSDFYKDKNKKDGLCYWCKKCGNRYSKKYHKENKEKIKRQAKIYYMGNIEYIKKRRKDYYIKNRESRLNYNKQFRKKYPIRIWCMKTIDYHKRKGFKVLFTWKELLPIAKQTKYCPLCNTKLQYGGGRSPNNATLDRINNENSLVLNNTPFICNTHIICHQCNTAKGQMTMTEFIKYCKNIVDRVWYKEKT